MASTPNRVNVFARVRPTLPREQNDLTAVSVNEAEASIRVDEASGSAVDRLLTQGSASMNATAAQGGNEQRSFTFDGTFDPASSQKEVFNAVGLPVLVDAMRGINGTIFAFGQTGSGKTHSLLNPGSGAGGAADAGLLPRLVATLFVRSTVDTESVYTVEAAAFQVYNEQIDDLLHHDYASGGGHNLNVTSAGGQGNIPHLSWHRTSSAEELLQYFAAARKNIVYAETKMNKASSRSHAAFQIRITRRPHASEAMRGQQLTATFGKLTIVDLAGSERVKRSGVSGKEFKEAVRINASLLALGNVVSSLAKGKGHAPFRDSKLTRVLEGSVGGNCRTALLVCVSPAADSTDESVGTLEFASRAMKVKVEARVNEGVVEVDTAALMDDARAAAMRAQETDPELLRRHRETEEALARASKQSLQLRQSVDQWQSAASKAETEAQALKLKMTGAAEAASKAENRATEAEAEVERLREETKRWNQEKADADAMEIEGLRKQLQGAEEARASERKALDGECQKLRKRLSSSEDTAVALKKELQAAKAEAASKKQSNDGLKKDLDKERVRASSLESELKDAKSQLKLALAQAESDSSEHRAISEAVLAAKQEKEEAEAAWEEEREQLQMEAEAAMEETQVFKDALKQAETALKESRDSAAAYTASSEAQNKDLESQVASLKQQAQALEEAADIASKAATAAEEGWRSKVQALEAQTQRSERELQQSLEESHTRCLRAEMRFTASALANACSSEAATRTLLRVQTEAAQQAAARAQEHAQQVDELQESQAHTEAAQRATEAEVTRLEAALGEAESEAKEVAAVLEENQRQQVEAEAAHAAKLQMAQEHYDECMSKQHQDLTSAADKAQRRLAAVFSAARGIAETRLVAAATEADDLRQRFEARESRTEDLELLQQQRIRNEKLEGKLRAAEADARKRKLELQYQASCDKIFASGPEFKSRAVTAKGALPKAQTQGQSFPPTQQQMQHLQYQDMLPPAPAPQFNTAWGGGQGAKTVQIKSRSAVRHRLSLEDSAQLGGHDNYPDDGTDKGDSIDSWGPYNGHNGDSTTPRLNATISPSTAKAFFDFDGVQISGSGLTATSTPRQTTLSSLQAKTTIKQAMKSAAKERNLRWAPEGLEAEGKNMNAALRSPLPCPEDMPARVPLDSPRSHPADLAPSRTQTSPANLLIQPTFSRPHQQQAKAHKLPKRQPVKAVATTAPATSIPSVAMTEDVILPITQPPPPPKAATHRHTEPKNSSRRQRGPITIPLPVAFGPTTDGL